MGNTIQSWAAVVGIIIPLITIAGSSMVYVINHSIEARRRKRENFFELMKYLDGNLPIATKIAAVYELRQYPQHREFIVRFCDSQKDMLVGPAAALLADEMRATSEFFSKH